SRRVGAVAGLGEVEAPLKARVLLPLRAVAELPEVQVVRRVVGWELPAVWVALPLTTRRVAVSALTVVVRRSLPVEALIESVLSAAARLLVSALYGLVRFLSWSSVKLRELYSFPTRRSSDLSRRVGAVAGLGEVEAPLKARVLLPL